MVCHGDIQDHHQILQCQECNLCAHTNCGGNGEPLSNQITHAKYIYWECPQCMLPNVSNSFFSLSDLDVSNSFSILDSCLEDEVFIPSEFTSSSPNPVKSTSKPTSGKKHQSIKIMFVNCRSLKSERKRHDFQELIETHQPDIICGQESHIDSTFTNGEIFPPRYNVSRKDRDIHGGGVFIAVSNKYISTTEYSLDTDCEIIWSKISIIGSKPLLIASFYRTTDDNMDPLLALNQSLRKLSNNGPLPNIILGGDLNFPDIDWENYTVKPNPQYGYRINRLMLEIAEEHGLQQLQKEPTRLNNVLDLLFTTYPDLVENVQVSSGMSDHCVVTAEVNVNPRAYKKPPRKVYMFKKMNVTQMKQDALDFKDHYLNHTSDANHIDVNWTTFKTKVSEILSDNVPTKTIKEKWDVPWMNSSIKRLIRKKHRAYNVTKKYNTEENRSKFRNLRKMVQRKMQSAKNNYLMGLLSTSNQSGATSEVQRAPVDYNFHVTKKFWSYVKSLKTNGSGVGTLIVDGQELSKAEEKATALSNQYSSVFTNEDTSNIPNMLINKYPTISDLIIDVNGVEKLLRNIDVKKASGPDGIPSQVLRDLSNELAPVVTKLFAQSLESGQLPSDWLTGNITALFKKGKKSDPANYRGVSLTSVTCKLLEHVIFRHIMNHLEQYQILSPFQHGFRSNHSCDSQLLITVEDLARNLDHGLQTDVLILDFQKAFDKVPHQRLLQKLNFYGIRGYILDWITQWLTSRTQCVVVDGEESEHVHVNLVFHKGLSWDPSCF